MRLGTRNENFDSWCTWERGAPELAVEIVGRSDAPEIALEKNLARYHELGVRELVWFDPGALPGEQLRVWDREEGDLVERIIEGDETPCRVLDLHWVIVPHEEDPAALRLAYDEHGEDLVLTRYEAEAKARREAELALEQLKARGG